MDNDPRHATVRSAHDIPGVFDFLQLFFDAELKPLVELRGGHQRLP
jgi:hypothetical protein